MKNKFLIGVLAFAFVFTMFGVSYAATEWSDDNTFTGIVNAFPNGITIGQQGTGGVTFFNGTIVNETTTTDTGDDIPVTFGDNVRIDGEIWRGEESGPGDDMPVKINDDVNLYGVFASDVFQETEYDGVLKAGLFYDADLDNVDRSFGLTVTATQNATGDYTFEFSEDIHERYFTLTPSGVDNAVCQGLITDIVTNPNGDTFEVSCFDEAAAAVDSDLFLSIY